MLLIEKRPVVTTRPTFEQAYNEILETAHLKEKTRYWVDAVNHDIATAHQFVDNLLEDLTTITKKRNRYLKRTSKLDLKLDNLPEDVTERLDVLYQRFSDAFHSYVKKSLENINNLEEPKMLVPLSLIKEKGNQTHFTWAYGPNKASKLEFIDIKYIHPEDFPKKITKFAQDALEILKTTYYDYQPKIMDGVLLREEAQPVINVDPALVLTLGERKVVVDYWKEPVRNVNNWGKDWLIWWMFVVAFVVFLLASKKFLDMDNSLLTFAAFFLCAIVTAFCFFAVIGGFFAIVTEEHTLGV